MRISYYARASVITAIILLFIGGLHENIIMEKMGELLLFSTPWTLLIYLSSKTKLKRWEKTVVFFLCTLYIVVLIFSLA
jgi:Ca2+/Na+ antiporter